jgi:transposase
MRRLQELPIQGVPATLEIRSGRWRCRNEQCARKTFAEALTIALPSARKTQRVGELVRLFAHAAGGRVSERLLTRLGMPVSDNAILRQSRPTAGTRSAWPSCIGRKLPLCPPNGGPIRL